MLLQALADDRGECYRSLIIKSCYLVMARNKYSDRLLEAGRNSRQKISVSTPADKSVHAQSTQPRMASGPVGLWVLNNLKVNGSPDLTH